MGPLPEWGVGLAGFLSGMACGYGIRRGKLCTFGAIEDWVAARDTRRLKVFALALIVAVAGTQALVVAGSFDSHATTYVPAAIPILSVILGSVLFGIGMSLVGTCGFGCLVRLGGGDLRALVVLLVSGAVAYAALRGVLLDLRVEWLTSWQIPLPEGTRAELAALLGRYLGAHTRVLVTIAVVAVLGLWVFTDHRLARTPRLVFGGVVLGLGVVAGWVTTGVMVDEFDLPRPQSLTFAGPIAKALFGLLGSAERLTDFAVASVFGVAAGAGLAAAGARQFRWEAFDDPREMRRHLAGAALMGFGGVTAGGCTIGQGLTAGSLLALTWPLAVAGLFIGARLGIFFILEGRFADAVRGAFPRLFGRIPY